MVLERGGRPRSSASIAAATNGSLPSGFSLRIHDDVGFQLPSWRAIEGIDRFGEMYHGDLRMWKLDPADGGAEPGHSCAHEARTPQARERHRESLGHAHREPIDHNHHRRRIGPRSARIDKLRTPRAETGPISGLSSTRTMPARCDQPPDDGPGNRRVPARVRTHVHDQSPRAPKRMQRAIESIHHTTIRRETSRARSARYRFPRASIPRRRVPAPLARASGPIRDRLVG